MEIKLAREMGFCPGVRRALKLVEKEARRAGQVHTLGTLIHNRQEVERLCRLGVVPATEMPGSPGATLAITAHGAPPAVIQEARDRGLVVVDITCPLVAKVQKLAKSLAERGYFVVVFGDAGHPEVKGILGWAGKGSAAATTVDRTLQQTLSSFWSSRPSRPARKLAMVSQTTQSVRWYGEFTGQLLRHVLSSVDEMAVHNTICAPTQSRQESVQELAGEVEVMIVVGGRDSANTRHLVELAREVGTEAQQIESAAELRPEWLAGKSSVGITAGASTPDRVVDEVVERVRKLG